MHGHLLAWSQTRMTEQPKNGTFEGRAMGPMGVGDISGHADQCRYIDLCSQNQGAQTFDIKSQLYVDHVSGTADSLKVYTYNSIDGVNWGAKTADSLTYCKCPRRQGLQATGLTFSDVIDVYKKFVIIQYGTWPKQSRN